MQIIWKLIFQEFNILRLVNKFRYHLGIRIFLLII